EQINQLYLSVNAAQMNDLWASQPHDFYMTVKNGSHLFQGITDSTLSHGQGWQFIQLGRFLERAVATAQLLNVEYQWMSQQPHVTMHSQLQLVGLLKTCTAFEAYTKVYTANLQTSMVCEFLLLNSEFPHAISFAVRMVQTALDAIAGATDSHKGARVYRLAGRLRAMLDYSQIDEIIAGGLASYLTDLRNQCIQLHDAIYQTFITYPIEERLAR
ncbi:MAG TPA: alpha-E domain-containing protein, partial [Caldilineaceae bacterium]|nr:alpha-E domain-containing protein [Caldilineaceae bacterium]